MTVGGYIYLPLFTIIPEGMIGILSRFIGYPILMNKFTICSGIVFLCACIYVILLITYIIIIRNRAKEIWRKTKDQGANLPPMYLPLYV
jgi:hypothetical protein